jgi:hypothetical protein
MKYLRVIVLSFILITCVFGKCVKERPCPFPGTGLHYSFSLLSKITPSTDSIKLGDTIWVNVNTRNTLFDSKTGDSIFYSGAINLGVDISIDKMLGNKERKGCASCFTLIPVKGKFIYDDTDTARGRDYIFVEDNNNYVFTLAMIPKERGTFAMAISDALNVYRSTDRCPSAAFTMKIENANQHLDLFEDNYPGYQITPYEATHVYCFKVY